MYQIKQLKFKTLIAEMRKTFILHFFLGICACYGLINLAGLSPSGLISLALFIGIFLMLWLLSFLFRRPYFYTIKGVINLAFYFFKELIISNFRIIYFILSPGHKFRPAVLELTLNLKSDFGITLLANLITLTPGTITLEISDDKKYLYFHVIDVPHQNIEKAKQKIKDGFEKRIMKIAS